MPELWDIYDRDRRLIGYTKERGMPLSEDEYHLVVQVWIMNSNGEWLISQRASNKSHPLKWEPPGGSVIAGENSLQGAVREVREELGISLETGKGCLFNAYRREKFCWENPGFLDIWVFKGDFSVNDLVLQREETCNAKWASRQEIIQMIQNDEFVPMKQFPYYIELFEKYQ